MLFRLFQFTKFRLSECGRRNLNSANDNRAPGAETVEAERHRMAAEERDDAWWYRIYGAVIIVAVLMITGLWLFSRTFSA